MVGIAAIQVLETRFVSASPVWGLCRAIWASLPLMPKDVRPEVRTKSNQTEYAEGNRWHDPREAYSACWLHPDSSSNAKA
jgi:hypothetical protein